MKDSKSSNLVSLINDDNDAADLIERYAFELEEVRKKIESLDKELEILRDREFFISQSVSGIVEIIGRNLPLAVQREGHIIVISEYDISVERNVIGGRMFNRRTEQKF